MKKIHNVENCKEREIKVKFDEFHSWECVSLLKAGWTVDFVIKNEEHMMAFLNVVGHEVYQQTDDAFMGIFLKLKVKAKLGYECWK